MNYQLLLAASLLTLGLLSGCDKAEQNAAGESDAAKPGVVQPSPAVSAGPVNAADTANDAQEMENQALPAEEETLDPDETAGGIYNDDESLVEEGTVEDGMMEEGSLEEGMVEEGNVDEGAVEEGSVMESEAVADEEEAPVDNGASVPHSAEAGNNAKK